MKKLICLFAISFALVGCKDEVQSHTQDWYKQHDAERKARVEVCRNDAKERATADCQNAIEADEDIRLFGK